MTVDPDIWSAIDKAGDTEDDAATEWGSIQDVADALGVPWKGLVKTAKAYTHGHSASHPILVRKLEGGPTQHKRVNEYRVDDGARWDSGAVEELRQRLRMTQRELADELGMGLQTARSLVNGDRWAGRKHHDALDELARRADEQADDGSWYAICDPVLDRHVVTGVTEDRRDAERRARSRSTDGPVTVVRGDGVPPDSHELAYMADDEADVVARYDLGEEVEEVTDE